MDKSDVLHAGNIAVFVFALIINGFSTIPFLNNRTIVQVSDLYDNLLTPAGYVFSIWGIIYSLLLVFVIYLAIPRHKNEASKTNRGLIHTTKPPKHCMVNRLAIRLHCIISSCHVCAGSSIGCDLFTPPDWKIKRSDSWKNRRACNFQRLPRLDNHSNSSQHCSGCSVF